MCKNSSVLFAILVTFSCNAHQIKVLIASSLPANQQWVLKTTKGFNLNQQPTKSAYQWLEKQLIIKPTAQGFLVNGKKIPAPLTITPLGNEYTFNNKKYHGSITLMPYKNNLIAIANVELEEYVARAVQAESYAHWPLEALKAQAIASRSYAVAMMLKAHAKQEPYDLTDSTFHQKSSGGTLFSAAKTATESTKNIMVGYEKKPALAMFSSCCGGVKPEHIGWVNFQETPYLKRPYACTYCKNAPTYRWKNTLTTQELTKTFKLPRQIKALTIAEKDAAGIVTKLAAHDGTTLHTVDAKKLYAAHRGIKSYYFDVTQKGQYVTFSGAGFGHHLGLCQRGAAEMARLGWNHRKIVQYYYPNTYLMKLA